MYQTVYDGTIASFATSSSEINLGKGWNKVFLEVPAMTSNSTLHIQAANSTGGTFRRVVQKDPASAVASIDWAVQSTCTNRIIACDPAAGLQYVKVESANILSFTAAFKIIVSDIV